MSDTDMSGTSTPQDSFVLLKASQAALQAGDPHRAEPLAVQFLAHKPGNVEGLVTLAHARRECGQFEAALRIYQAILAERPQHVGAEAGMAATLFAMERWAEAWEAFDVRFRMMDDPPKVTKRGPDGAPVDVPMWTGGPVPRRLLVMAEQGLGDTLQFARFLPDLARAGCDVHFVVEPKLMRLLRTQDCPITYRARGVPGQVDGITAWVPLMGLARALGTAPADYIRKGGYLKADPARMRHWASRLPQGGYRIGIAWQGNPDPRIDKGRSMPLAALEPLAHLAGVQLVSLQKGAGEEQIAQVPFGARITRLDGLDEGPDAFLDTAAVMAHLDCVVTVDTALAHLAGALDVPGFILLKACGADWRWMARPHDNIWYGRTQLVRQARFGDWDDVVRRLCGVVEQRMKGRKA